MDPNSSPANNDTNATPPAEAATPVALPPNPNDLETEMTPEQEQAFVNDTLGIKGASAEPVAPVTPVPTPPAPETPPVETPPETPPVAPVVPEPVAPPITPEPPTPVEIAEPQTDDLWVEVKDAEGKDIKLVYDPNDPSSFLPEGFTFKDDTQLFTLLDAKNEMAALYKERVGQHETAKTAAEQEIQAVQTEKEVKASWDAEIEDLIESGILEAPKTAVTDPKAMEDPTIKTVAAVFDFMKTQNITRLAEGKPALRSFGTAFNMYNADITKKAADDKTKAENAAAKARGALVGGTSAPSVGEAPVYKHGSASNIWQVPITD